MINQYHLDPEVYRMLENFRHISGLRVGVHDLNMDILVENPPKSMYYDQLRFCDKIRFNSPEYTLRCRKCDMDALKSIMITKKSMIYRCHAGFTEALIPVISNGHIICVLMIGQIRNDKTNEETFEKIIKILPSGFMNDEIKDDLKKSFYQMPTIEEEKFRALVYVLEICAQSIFNNHLIMKDSDKLIDSFISYIDENLYKPITIKQTADVLSCSTSHLSRKIASDLHTTFTDYLVTRRMEAAKDMLITTDLPVKMIALTLCYDEPSYFMRVFKRCTGKTCSEFRKSAKYH